MPITNPMPPLPTQPVTVLLRAARDGDVEAMERVARLLYDELHALAASCLRRERSDHTLQPTALVSEAFLKLMGQQRADWRNRSQFFGVAADVMRRLLVDHARRVRADKRDGGIAITLDEGIGEFSGVPLEILRVNEALDALARIDARQARIVELRFFVGLTIDQTAEVLGISPATVSREWALARAVLHSELSDE